MKNGFAFPPWWISLKLHGIDPKTFPTPFGLTAKYPEYPEDPEYSKCSKYTEY